MSIKIMFRKCQYCKHVYTYNPSVGKFGHICPKCMRLQDSEELKGKKK